MQESERGKRFGREEGMVLGANRFAESGGVRRVNGRIAAALAVAIGLEKPTGAPRSDNKAYVEEEAYARAEARVHAWEQRWIIRSIRPKRTSPRR